jgi:two-component system response regulator
VKSILLVEDTVDDEELTKMSLARAGIRNPIHVARDGVEAVAFLHGDESKSLQAQALPLIVLLDLKLPKLDGFDVLSRIRASPRTRRLPVVVLTSSSNEEDIVRSYDLGVNSYVRKPVDFGAFAAAVRDLGMYWILLNTLPPEV